jgi:hypothetical protein
MSSQPKQLLYRNTQAICDYTRNLFRALRGRFNDNILREIILASAGLKTSRTCMSASEIELFLPIARRNRLKVVCSKEKYIHRMDIGKGGWANTVERAVPSTHPDGLFNVYIASDAYLAEMSIRCEEQSNQDEFGLLLGIPDCCRQAYVRAHPIAQLKQNDFVPIVLDNTTGDIPYNYWNNYVSQYFGRSLLSFFPCSFNCPHAAKFAQETCAILQQCSDTWAMNFVQLQQTNILYTEYFGLHLLLGSSYQDGWITYDPSGVLSTERTEICALLALGNRLKVLNKHCAEIYNDQKLVSCIEGEDTCICLFA